MYICLCMGVSDGEIQQVVSEGACSVQEVMQCTGAGTRCGSCRPSIHSLISTASLTRDTSPSSGRVAIEMEDQHPASSAA